VVQLQGHVPHALGVVAMWIYLLFAFVALPTLVPTMVLLLEPRGRRRVIAPFLALVWSRRPLARDDVERSPSAKLGSYHVAYSIGLQHGVVIIACTSSRRAVRCSRRGLRNVVWFGAVNLSP